MPHFCFLIQGLMGSPDWPGYHYVDQAVLELVAILPSVFWESSETADVFLTTEPSLHPLNTVVLTLKLQANTDLRASCCLETPASRSAL